MSDEKRPVLKFDGFLPERSAEAESAGLSFALYPGEGIGVIGETGSDADRLADAVLGALPHRARARGKIWLNGLDILAMSESEMSRVRGRHAALLTCSGADSFDPAFSVGSQLGELLKRHMRLRGAALSQREVELMDMVGIAQPEECLKSRPGGLPRGVLLRAELAMALACEPTLVIAQDFTAGLDALERGDMIALIRALHSKMGFALMVISQDIAAITALCTRACVMFGGHMLEIGNTADVLSSPAHPYTAALVESAPAKAVYDGRAALSDEIPRENRMSSAGCIYAANCRRCMALCLRQPPEMFSAGQKGHSARCWLQLFNEGGNGR